MTRFSLRALLVGIAVLALCCAWVGKRTHQIRNEITIANLLTDTGADVAFHDADDPYRKQSYERRRPLPGWLIQLCGIEPTKHATSITWFQDRSVTDAACEHLQDLPYLSEVRFMECPRITGEGVDHIAGLRIKILNLSGSPISDCALIDIARLPHLTILDLTDTAITDDGLKHLHSSRSLSWISLVGTQVTKNGVARLRARLKDCDIIVD
jgi:hypothetical protein